MSGSMVQAHFQSPREWRPYPAYKDSGVEWLGYIPAHWRTKRLKYLSSINDEALGEDTDPELEVSYVDIGSVDAIEGIVQKEQFVFAQAPSRARRVVRDGDVIVSTVRTYLRAIAPITNPEPGLIVSTGFAVIRPKQELDSCFASYALRAPHFIERVVANSVGVSYPAINSGEMACFGIALPDVREQRAIAAFLDHETGKIDALVAKKERLVELLQEKRAALITHSVTKGLDPTVPTKDSDVQSFGRMPAHWEIKRLMHVTPDHRPIMYGIVLPGPNVDDGVPIVKGGDVSPGRLRLDLLNRTTREIEAGYARSRLRGGDIVYAIRGSIGSAEIVPPELESANLTQDAARVAPGLGTNERWLLFALRAHAVFGQLEAGAMGAAVKGINIRDLKRAILPVPPKEEQNDIATYLTDRTDELDALTDKIYEGIEKLKEYRSALISAAVTGKIDVRERLAGSDQVSACTIVN